MDTEPEPQTPPLHEAARPHGPGLTIDSMREIAQRNGASTFVEQLATDESDYGYLLNPKDSALQFGVATYQTAHHGFSVTHSIAAFIPSELLLLANRYSSDSSINSHAYYSDVIDITVPYVLPHMIIAPKVSSPGSAFLGSLFNLQTSKGATDVRLEGDFSEFINARTVKGQDVTAFIYLAPDVMDSLLPLAKTITVEWIGNHIYIYYRQDKVSIVNPEFNTPISGKMHEKFLQAGLQIADKLGKNARPARVLDFPIAKIGRSRPKFSFSFFTLFQIIAFLGFMPALLMGNYILGVIFAIIILPKLTLGIVASMRAAHLSKRYNLRYGHLNSNIDLP